MTGTHETEFAIRVVVADDIPSIAAIYAPYVTDTIISFESVPPDADEMRWRIEGSIETFPWLVCTHGDTVCGYAYASAYRSREAYRWSAEVSVYVDDRWHRRRIGRALYAALLAVLEAQGYCNVYAGVALPNPASEAFHRVCGFEPIGVYKKVGYKNGAWHDVAWFGLRLGSDDHEPSPPRGFAELRGNASLATLLAIGERLLAPSA